MIADFSAVIRASLRDVYPNQKAIMESLSDKLIEASTSPDLIKVEATLISVSMISKVCAEMVREEITNEALV